MSEPLTALDRLWDAMWEDLRHNATCRPSGLAIIATHRPAIEAEVRFEAARTTALDVDRLARAIRNALWPNWVNEPDRPSLFWHADAAKVAAEYAALAQPPESVR